MPPVRLHSSYDFGRGGVALCLALVLPVVGLAIGCGPSAEERRLRETSRGEYDPATGVLTAITYDRNKNGRIDTWTKMDGTRPLSSEIDTDEDGRIDRWEEYGEAGALTRAGWIRVQVPAPGAEAPSAPDTWLYPSPDGRSHRIEFLDIDNGGNQVVSRREFYENDQLVRVEEDKDGDDLLDQWETWQGGVLRTVEFDDGRDGTPDRRFTYDKGALVLIESEPDANGTYTRRVVPGGR